MLATKPDGFADCIVTSPPYWAKRDYGVTGQYGLEPDPDSYIATLRNLFREAHRVLAADGTCWLNLGDSYSAGSASPTGLHAYLGPDLAGRTAPGTTAKNLPGLPWRVALALHTTAGSSAKPSCGTRPTRCPSRSATASTAGTS